MSDLPQLFTLKQPDRVPWCEEHSNGGSFGECLACALQEMSRVLSQIDCIVTRQMVAPYDVDCDPEGVLERAAMKLFTGKPDVKDTILPHSPSDLLERLNRCQLTGGVGSVYVPIDTKLFMQLLDLLSALRP